MLKKHMAACLVASAFITIPALAQTSPSPGTTSPGADQPAIGASGGAMGAGAGAATAGASGKFITQQQGNQWRASRLIGLAVHGSNNERIGDINEVLVDRQGKADGVVVGVGGFLGIGEKNVALPFDAFEWMMEDTKRTASASGTGTTGSTAGTGTAGTAGSTTMGTAGTGAGPASPGATGSTSGAARSDTAGASAARSSAERGYPDHAVLRMTKADLETAPTFRYMGDTRTEDRAAAPANRPATATPPAAAPRQ